MRAKLGLLAIVLVATTVLSPLLVTDVRAAPCTPTCLEADTNIPASQATVMIRVNGTAMYTLNQTFVLPYNSTINIQLLNTTVNVPSLGVRYVFRQWSWVHNGFVQWDTNPTMKSPTMLANYTSTTNGAFMAQFDEQFQLTLAFIDASGASVNPPSSVILCQTIPCSGQGIVSLTSFTNQWLTGGNWTVADATWEGASEANLGTPSIDLNQPLAPRTIQLKAYSATLRLVNSQNNPLQGASVTVTFVNQTSRTFATDSQGLVRLGRVPIGPYVAHVTYQGQDISPYSIDASTTPNDTITLSSGGQTSQPVVSAIVLVSILGVAVFLVVMALRVRKPPLPPVIN